jgi:TonB-linked SusC/RagA family outer membrane protein
MKKNLFFFVLFFSSLCVAYGQTRTISGVVADSKGEPIVGVGVKVKGTTVGAITDMDGKYTIAVPSGSNTLVYSYVGMKTKEVVLGADNNVAVGMEEDALVKDEVIVTAVGVKREKKKLGYAVQDVKGEDMSISDNANAMSNLSGRVAGVQVNNSSGSPGGSARVVLRGPTSLMGNNQPLMVVNGVPFNNNELGNATDGVGQSNRGIDINPDDIESITVLKGPAATALYGLQASSGAILITTKKGIKPGAGKKINVSYSSSVSFSNVTKLPELQNKFAQGKDDVYMAPETQWGRSWGPDIDNLYWDGKSDKWDVHGAIFDKRKVNSVAGMTKVAPYDNVKTFFKTGTNFENNLSFTGGNEGGSYRLSVGNLTQTGVIPVANFTRNTISLSADNQLSKKIRSSANISYSNSGGRRVQQGSNISGLMLGLLRTPITFDNSNGTTDYRDSTAYIFPDGTQRTYRNGIYDNPYFTINKNKVTDRVNRIFGSAQLDYQALDWLAFTYRVGTDFYSDLRSEKFPIISSAYDGGRVQNRSYYYQHINADLIGRASKRIGEDFDVSLLVGHNMYSKYERDIIATGTGFSFADFEHISNAASITSLENVFRKRTMAMYAELQLDYKRMLYVNATARREQSSTLPKKNNTFYYPSVSASFVFTEALKMNDNKWLPYGKIRASWAQVGKDPDEYKLSNYYFNTLSHDGWPASATTFPFNGLNGFTTDPKLGNTNLKPEKTNSIEVGTELKFINNRVGINASYYHTLSKDQIFSAPVASSTGYNQLTVNAGSLESKGVELELMTTPVKLKDFQWNMNINWSRNRTFIKELAPGVDNLFLAGFTGSDVRLVPGQQYASIFGNRWKRDGNGNVIINDTEFINGNPNPNYGKPIMDEKQGVIGCGAPKWLAGISNTFIYKRVSLTALVNIKHGGDMWNGTKGALTTFGRSKVTEYRGEEKIFDGVKQSNGSKNDIKTVLNEKWYTGLGGGFNGPAEQFVEDGSFVRLTEVALAYEINPEYLKRVHVTGLSVSVYGRNLWLKTKYSGVDPDTSLVGGDNGQGIDYFNNPGVRTLGAKIRLLF